MPAKDGSSRGGARVGAGRKPGSRIQKLMHQNTGEVPSTAPGCHDWEPAVCYAMEHDPDRLAELILQRASDTATLGALVPAAIRVLRASLQLEAEPRVRLTAARDLLDRALGKPVVRQFTDLNIGVQIVYNERPGPGAEPVSVTGVVIEHKRPATDEGA